MAKIVVSGYMVRYPLSGLLLAYFNYVLGLHRLGHEVIYIEESGWPDSCFDPQAGMFSSNPEAGLKILRALLAQFEGPNRVYYVDRESGAVHGGTSADVRRELTEADLLLNLGGVCWLDEFALCRHRILLDMDPLFTQVGLFGAKSLGEYHVHLSYGMNIGKPQCTIPAAGFAWRGTVPPVIPELWSPAPPAEVFTTVAHWSAYGGVEYEGKEYGQKDVEFLRLMDLPALTDQRLELALSGGEDVRPTLRQAGWSVFDSDELNRNLEKYRQYICSSRGEFSAAKNAYVQTRSGWFSDRTVCYLAASRPVVIQDVGAGDWLPTGRGVLIFSTIEEAAQRLAEVNADYNAHCRAARELAAELFDYRKVLPRIIEAEPVQPSSLRAQE